MLVFRLKIKPMVWRPPWLIHRNPDQMGTLTTSSLWSGFPFGWGSPLYAFWWGLVLWGLNFVGTHFCGDAFQWGPILGQGSCE